MHEHFDVDGNQTGHTIITRESAWDDDSRARALALAEWNRNLCRCGCGLPIADAYRKQPFVVHEATCEAGRALAQHRRHVAKDAISQKKSDGWNDGTYYYVLPVGDDSKEA